jgi:hypothetical protein
MPLFQVVIGKKKSNAPVIGASKALKKVPLIDLSDSKEVCGLIFVSKLFSPFFFFFFFNTSFCLRMVLLLAGHHFLSSSNREEEQEET